MNIKKAIELERKDFEKRMEIRWKKGYDYAKVEGDILSNFKVMADLEKILDKHGYSIPIDRPCGVALWHLLHKIIRLLNLLNKGTDPQNETINDTFLDMSNYTDLTKECLIDEEK